MKSVFGFLAFVFLQFGVFASAEALQKINYYGDGFYNSSLKDDQLKQMLKTILKSGHIKNEGSTDKLVASCNGAKNCYMQTSIGYDGARKFLFGKFYLVKLDSANYGIKEMYCDRIYQKEDFSKGPKPGNGIVPDSTIMNVEHTWPQSKFTGKYPKDLQKADIHHLFPTDSKMNSTRGNYDFGEVNHDDGKVNCNASRIGTGVGASGRIFEPPQDHKGRVARALFYFSIRYDLPISPANEQVLKRWSHESPVDEEEKIRNEEIFKIQGNRNPFVDYPELANSISDF